MTSLVTDKNTIGVDNQIILTGLLLKMPKFHTSPAGIESAHFMLWHKSEKPQKVEFSINISSSDAGLIAKLKQLDFNAVRLKTINLKVRGYLAKRKYSNGDEQFVLQASDLKII